MALPAVKPKADVLQKLKTGEITLEQYLDETLESALDHIRGVVPLDRLDMIREVLREHVRTDPVTLEMVRQVTGISVPQLPDDARH